MNNLSLTELNQHLGKTIADFSHKNHNREKQIKEIDQSIKRLQGDILTFKKSSDDIDKSLSASRRKLNDLIKQAEDINNTFNLMEL